MPIIYIEGDDIFSQGDSPKIIAHFCNNLGIWETGFVLALSKRWEEPEIEYRQWAKNQPLVLGEVQLVSVAPELWVANIIGKQGIHRKGNALPLRYKAIRQGLHKVASLAQEHKASVHMPRVGTGLAVGDWYRISDIIADELKDVQVVVYDLPKVTKI